MQDARDDLQAVRLTVPGVDPDRLMLAGVDTHRGPLFSVGEMTKVLLGDKSQHTLRWREMHGRLGRLYWAEQPVAHAPGSVTYGTEHLRFYVQEPGAGQRTYVPVQPGERYVHPENSYSVSARHARVFTPDGHEIGVRTAGGARRYSLADAERMVHAMVAIGDATAEEAALMLVVIAAQAALAGYLPKTIFIKTPDTPISKRGPRR